MIYYYSNNVDRRTFMDIFETVKAITAEQLDIDESLITMDSSFINDLEADSLDLVQLLMAFEDEYDMEISDEEAEEISTVGDAVNYIKENLN
jgi:acyl carrier protein